jgi:hypothetical protein
MDIRGIIQSDKRIKNSGIWATGTMPRTAFPLSKSGGRSYRLGNRRWRVITFDAAGFACRLLINYSYMLSQYQAMLGVDVGGVRRCWLVSNTMRRTRLGMRTFVASRSPRPRLG